MQSEDELHREEVRCLFVVGVLGTLLGILHYLEIEIMPGLYLGDIAVGLMVFWLGYLFLMAIGISNDLIFKPEFCEWCRNQAKIWFAVGIGVTPNLAILVTLAFTLERLIPSPYTDFGAVIALLISCGLCYYLYNRITI